MGVFGNITGIFGSSGSVFMIIVLAVADHLWGENVFNCPCGGYRILYTCAFLIVPPVVIIIIGRRFSSSFFFYLFFFLLLLLLLLLQVVCLILLTFH